MMNGEKSLSISAVIALLLAVACGYSFADTVYLKNGRSLSGIIKNDDEQGVEIEVCAGGTIKLDKKSVERIERKSEQEAYVLRRRWELEKQEYDQQSEQYKLQEERRPKDVEFSQDGNAVLVQVTINRKVKASLILDTGASAVMLKKKVAKELGINVEKAVADAKITLADGRAVPAKHIVLDSIEVQGVQANNVDAVVLMDEQIEGNIRDGLLGMSFLNRFNFKIDRKEKKLVLEKL